MTLGYLLNNINIGKPYALLTANGKQIPFATALEECSDAKILAIDCIGKDNELLLVFTLDVLFIDADLIREDKTNVN